MPIFLICIFWLGIGLVLTYEFFALSAEQRIPHETISEITWRVSTKHPLVPFLMGILMGHFFWQSTSVYLGNCK